MEGNSIGSRVAERRNEMGLKQRELADMLSVKRETVNQWENGIRQIKGEDIARLADALETTTDYILRGIKPENLDIARETGLSDKAIEVLRKIAPSAAHRDGWYTKKFSDCLSGLIESKYLYDLLNSLGAYLIYGGAVQEDKDMPHIEEVDIGIEEWKRFMSWADQKGQELIPRDEAKDLYLQKACDAFRDACKEMLEHGKHSREKE